MLAALMAKVDCCNIDQVSGLPIILLSRHLQRKLPTERLCLTDLNIEPKIWLSNRKTVWEPQGRMLMKVLMLNSQCANAIEATNFLLTACLDVLG